MKQKSAGPHRQSNGFTLIELLVVISIIGTLAALLLPAISRAKIQAKEKMAQVEMANLNAAISAYYGEYNTLPASTNATAGAAKTGGDFTFGTQERLVPNIPNDAVIVSTTVTPQAINTPQSPYQNVNSEVIAILTDAAYYPENGHTYNPQKTTFYNGRAATDTNSPGIGPDNVLRDPFGTPYMITLDLNYDGKCVDQQIWSGLFVGNPNFGGVPGSSMIWSFGYLKTIDWKTPYNSPINKHLLTSWK